MQACLGTSFADCGKPFCYLPSNNLLKGQQRRGRVSLKFLPCRTGQNEASEYRGEGWGVGMWQVGGRPAITASLQGKLSFQAAWKWSTFHLQFHWGRQTSIKSWPRDQRAEALTEQLKPPQVGTGIKDCLSHPIPCLADGQRW